MPLLYYITAFICLVDVFDHSDQRAMTSLTDEQSLSPPHTPGRNMSDAVRVTFTRSSVYVVHAVYTHYVTK